MHLMLPEKCLFGLRKYMFHGQIVEIKNDPSFLLGLYTSSSPVLNPL